MHKSEVVWRKQLNIREEGENGFKMNAGRWRVFQRETMKRRGDQIFWEAQAGFRAGSQGWCQDKGCCAPWCQAGSQRQPAARRLRAETRDPLERPPVRCLFFCLLRELNLK